MKIRQVPLLQLPPVTGSQSVEQNPYWVAPTFASASQRHDSFAAHPVVTAPGWQSVLQRRFWSPGWAQTMPGLHSSLNWQVASRSSPIATPQVV
jgi:hypothetical protein